MFCRGADSLIWRQRNSDGPGLDPSMTDIAIALIALVALTPLMIWAVRFARRHRRTAFAAASLLLLFGVNFTVDPPPPPRVEAAEHDEEEAEDAEPK